MKDKSRLIFFTITLLAWFMLIRFYMNAKQGGKKEPGPQQTEQPAEKTPAPEETDDKGPDGSVTESSTEEQVPPDTEEQPVPEDPAEQETVVLNTGKDENSGYITEFSNRGACITSLTIKRFYEDKRKKDRKLTLFSSERSGLGGLQILRAEISRGKSVPSVKLSGPDLESRLWSISDRTDTSVSFSTSLIPGVTLKKDISFNADSNCFIITLTQKNTTDTKVTTSCEMTASPGLIPEYEDLARTLKAVVSVKDDSGKEDLDTLYFKSVAKEGFLQEKGLFSWIAGCNKYFTVFLKYEDELSENCSPVLRGRASPHLFARDGQKKGEGKPVENILTSIQIFSISTDPDGASSVSFTYYALPLRKKELKKTGIQYRELISPGHFTGGVVDALAELFLIILKYIHAVFPNWGIAIILLTCLVNAALYPFNKKGQISMHRMQKLQPAMKEIRKKHKNNKQKMNEEMMKLYHKHQVNPMGGCLPMLIQLPIFIGLLFALRSSFELRQSGFLWIEDLSLPDALFRLPFNAVPSFNLLPILMTVAMLIQQKIAQPAQKESKKSAQDEPDTQKQMQGAMKIMPWFMLVILYKFSSGLILYWTVNSVLRIFETYHIKKRLIPRLEKEKK